MTLRQVFFYILYFLAAFVLFAILCFPREQAAKTISNKMTRIFPHLTLKMETADPFLPSGIECKNPKIMLGNTFSIPFDTFKLHFPLLGILKQDKEMTFSGTLLEGVLNGRAEAISFSRNSFSKLELNMTGIHIKKVNYKTPDVNMDLSFELKGSTTFPEDKDRSKASGTLILTNVVSGMKDSIFNRMGIDTLEFTHIEIEFLLDKKQITIPKFIAIGNVMTIRLKGTLTPAQDLFEPWENWSIDLKGFMQPQPAYIPKLASVSSMATLFKDTPQKGIPIHITGPLKAPEIKL